MPSKDRLRRSRPILPRVAIALAVVPGLLAPGRTADAAAAPARPNVVLIVIDTLGAEYLGALDPKGENRTPNLDRLAASGVLFRRAYSTAPWTQPAVASLLTSRMPADHGLVRLFGKLPGELETLAEVFRREGHSTAAVISHFLLDAVLGFDQGFEHFDPSPVGGHEAVTSHLVTDQAIAWLKERPAGMPFLLLAHYFDPHYVYHHHPEFDLTSSYRGSLLPGMDIWKLRDARSKLTAADVHYLKSLYREEIAYTDHHVGRLLDALQASGLDEETVVVVTADHGEEFLRHGWIGHTRTLYDELLHVPLILAAPGRWPPGVVSEPVSLLDVLPTLADVVLGRAPGPGWAGVSLRSSLEQGRRPPVRDLLAEVSFTSDPGAPAGSVEKTAFKTSLVRGTVKLIHDLPTDRWQLFDLRSDPEELRDRWRNDRRGRRLQQRLLAWERSRPPEAAQPPAVGRELSAELLEQLRALGYVD